MNSPRFPPAGLLVRAGRTQVMLDGGPPGAVPAAAMGAWLVTDKRGELVPAIRRIAKPWGVAPAVAEFSSAEVTFTPLAVEHSSHPACGYLIEASEGRAVWAPEFVRLPFGEWGRPGHRYRFSAPADAVSAYRPGRRADRGRRMAGEQV